MSTSVPGARRGARGSFLLALLALVATPLALPSPAAAAADHLVISEVYGGGGNFGAPLTNDFVELYNPTDAAISLSGMSIQYRSASGTGNGINTLSGTVAPHAHFLVQQAAGSTPSGALPTPDATGSLAMSGTAGIVFLASTTDQVTLTAGTSTGNAAVIDLIGYGSAAVSFESASAGGLSNSTSASRNATGDDSNSNSADFTVGAPNPQNSGATTPPADPPVAKTIAEIQGTGADSPLVGTAVVTTGVVTASYPTGGLKGFTIQTAGTGGALDLGTHTASDGLFVYAGNIAAASYPAVGANVQVTGPVSEFAGLTEISPASEAAISVLPDPVTAPTPASVTWPAGAAQRESLESMVYAPSGPWTVTDVYELNQYGEINLARGTSPLRTPTDVARPGSPAALAVANQNAARSLTLDDGASADFFGAAKNTALPWITQTSSVRVGAAVTFTKPVVVSYRNGAWKLQPTAQLDAADTNSVRPATFSDTRTAAPEPVEGKLKVASFNVLNYFTQTAADWTGANAANTCTAYNDRAGAPVAVRTCSGDGPRGAWDLTNRQRQQAKIVKAINALGADVLGLEEIENSAKYGADRDVALSTLVDALNADAGSNVWSFRPSPVAAQRPAVADEDVIRTAFIYKAAKVEPVGPSKILTGAAAFSNAREPLAQVFKPVGGTLSQQFLVAVNHFKSKGSGTGPDADTGDGQGASNFSRVNQAKALVAWINQLKTATATTRVFLTGDFNSYTSEDPMKVLYDAGYTDIGSTLADEFTYVFDGAVGSLDHVLGNADAMAGVKGASVWNINSVESVAYEYSRHNYNATDFYVADPYRSSDHDPLVVGFDSPAATSESVPLNLLDINDFHGRIDTNTTAFATTVEQLREAAGEDNTLFLAAGDNISASLFASASADDNPTIDVLNALGLDASSVGNHEFDKGFADLTGHVNDRANWDYLGANVYLKGTETPALQEYKVFTKNGVKVGVIGATTEETPSLVSPGGVSTIDFGDPVEAVNRVAGQLTDGNQANGEADVIVATFHAGAGEGAPDGATYEEEVAAGGEFANIVNGLSPKVAAIFTGHTHKQYSWDAPIPGQPGKTRPVMQTGEYGNNVGQIRLMVDPTTKAVTSYSQAIVARSKSVDLAYPRVAEVKTIVDAALTAAAAVGNQVKGSVSADITTAYGGGSYVDGKYVGPDANAPKAGRDERSLESTLGNKVADALLDNLSTNGAELGIVNPGGLRDELFKAPDGNVTYAEANAVLPFVNNLWTIDLTGAQLKKVLEQQWQPAGSSRPFLHLGLSKNVSVTLEPSKPVGERVTSVRINGEPLDPARSYKVGTFSFLTSGGDNFTEFRNGTNAVDTGKVDRDAWIDYVTAHSPMAPAFDRREVEGNGFPAEIEPGDAVTFGLSRLDLTSIGSPLNTGVTGVLRTPAGDTPVGSWTVASGAATVAFTAPATVPAGSSYVFTAQPSGTTVTIPAIASTTTPQGPVATTTTATIGNAAPVVRSTRSTVTVKVASAGGPVNGGTVEIGDGTTILGTGTVLDGSVAIQLPEFRSTGTYDLAVRYLGTAGANASATTLRVTAVPATVVMSTKVAPAKRRKPVRVTVRLSAVNGPVTGYVVVREKGKVLGLATVVNGTAKLRLAAYPRPGRHTLTVSYLGSDLAAASTQVVRLRVR